MPHRERRRQLARRRDVAADTRRRARCPTPLPRTSTAGSPRRRRPTASSTGDAALTTTIVRGFTAATARTRSSCAPGSVIDSRSLPFGLPLAVGADDAQRRRRRARAAATARSSRSSRAGGARPTDEPAERGRGRDSLRRRPRSARPATSSTVAVELVAAHAVERVAALGRIPVVEDDVAVDAATRARPACTTLNVHAPDSGGTRVARRRTEKSSGTPPPTGPIHVKSARAAASSTSTGSPARSRPA